MNIFPKLKEVKELMPLAEKLAPVAIQRDMPQVVKCAHGWSAYAWQDGSLHIVATMFDMPHKVYLIDE